MHSTTIRVREPRELLALLPFQLGFRPENSAVAVALRPPRGRVGLIARVDLPDLAEPDRGPELSRRLVTHLVGDGASRAVLVVYAAHDPRPWAASSGDPEAVGAVTLPAAALAGSGAGEGGVAAADVGAVALDDADVGAPALQAVKHFRDAAAAFLGDVAVWVVACSGYLSPDCDDAACCPPGGRPLHELQSTEVGAHMVLAGAMVADSRDALVLDRPAPARARRNAVRAARRSAARRAAATGSGDLQSWRLAALGTWRAQVSAAPGAPAPTPAVLGRLAAGLADTRVRDAVLLSLVDEGDLPERSVAVGAPGDDALTRQIAHALAAVVSRHDGVPPEARTLAAATVLLEQVVAHAAGPQRAPALTLLALLAWWHGDGARAAVLLERALRADPGHRLAELLAEALASGLAPGWVRATR